MRSGRQSVSKLPYFGCLSFPSGFVRLSFSTAEVDVQPAAVSGSGRKLPFLGPMHSLNRATPSRANHPPHVRVRRLGSSRVDALWLAASSAILHLPPSPRTIAPRLWGWHWQPGHEVKSHEPKHMTLLCFRREPGEAHSAIVRVLHQLQELQDPAITASLPTGLHTGFSVIDSLKKGMNLQGSRYLDWFSGRACPHAGGSYTLILWGSRLLRDPSQFSLGPQGTQWTWCATRRHCESLDLQIKAKIQNYTIPKEIPISWVLEQIVWRKWTKSRKLSPFFKFSINLNIWNNEEVCWMKVKINGTFNVCEHCLHNKPEFTNQKHIDTNLNFQYSQRAIPVYIYANECSKSSWSVYINSNKMRHIKFNITHIRVIWAIMFSMSVDLFIYYHSN